MADSMLRDAFRIEALVESAAAGDEAAFARLVAEHHATMARVAFVICGEADLTRDVVQTAWTIAWRRIGSLREPARVRAWLVAIAANEARKSVARRRRSGVVDISAEVAGAEMADPAELVDLVDLDGVLRGLHADERALLALRFAAGLDATEIGAQLGLSASGVRSRLARLIDRIRTDLALDSEDTP